MKPLQRKISLAGLLITLAGAILFSTKAIFVKLAFAATGTDPLSLLTLRMVFSLPFYIGAAAFASTKSGNKPMRKKQWLTVVVLGLFGYYLSSFLDFEGLQYISAGLERLILFLYPTIAIFINAAVYKQKITGRQKIALGLTYVGIAIAYFGELRIDTQNPEWMWGSLLVFLCAITYAVYITGSGKIIPVIGAAKFTAYAMLSATAGIFIHFLFAGNVATLNTGMSLWWYGLMLAIVATVIPSFLISNGMKRIGSNNVAIVSGIGPISTIVQAHFLLGEKIFALQIAGTALVIAGIILIGWQSKSPENKSETL